MQGDGSPAPVDAAAEAGPYWSLMFEVSESPLKPVGQALEGLGGGLWPAVVRETLAGALATRMVTAGDRHRVHLPPARASLEGLRVWCAC